LDPCSHEAANCHIVCFRRNATRGVGDDVNVVAVAHRVDRGHCNTHLRPESGHDQFLPARLSHRLDDPTVLPAVDESAVNRLLIRKDSLNLLENKAPSFLVDCGENRRNAICLRGLRKTGDVVDHYCGVVTVYVRQLERLVVNENQGTILRCQKSVQPDLRERLHPVILPYPIRLVNWFMSK